MASSTHRQPELQGAFSNEHAPQVVVRAGKTFVCSACGTLVEIPKEVVGQLVLAAAPASSEEQGRGEATEVAPSPTDSSQHQPPIDEATGVPCSRPRGHAKEVTPKESARSAPGAKQRHAHADVEMAPVSKQPRPTRPKRPRSPARECFVGQTIDGLTVPSARQLDRALAWVSFHLRILDRQGSEIQRLRKLLKQRSNSGVPCPRPRGPASEVPVHDPVKPAGNPNPKHAQEDLGVAPESDCKRERNANERGPP
ncbi:hypothetical protein [Bremerella sp.]|uniref:hypothetical protein n=1 Tax=Bremerella sp. TaxID=2795602 RepID=UPI00391C0F53